MSGGGGGGIDPLSLIKRFSDEEKALSSELFLAPYLPGGRINVRVKGVVYELSVVDAGALQNRCGFGLFEITAPGQARLVELADREMVTAYLNLLPKLSLVLLGQFEQDWWGLQANASDTRFNFAEPVPLRLPDRVAPFEQVYARFDGSSFWFQGNNRRRDPTIGRRLREALSVWTHPDALRVTGATPQELFAYRIVFFDSNPQARLDSRNANRSDVDRIRDALTHAGGRLDTYWQRGENIVSVRYVIDGHTHVADVRLNDLSVISSGICLSGRDRDFDLSSLVGVMRQYHSGQHRR